MLEAAAAHTGGPRVVLDTPASHGRSATKLRPYRDAGFCSRADLPGACGAIPELPRPADRADRFGAARDLGALVFSFLDLTTINIYSQVGLITLVGLIAKNGILIVEFSNVLQARGLSKAAALKEAS